MDAKEESFELNKKQRRHEVDLLSIEFMANTRQYSKYLAKNLPQDQQEKRRLVESHRSKIKHTFLEILDQYPEDFHSQHLNAEIHAMLYACIDRMAEYMEWTKYRNTVPSVDHHQDGEHDEEVLFDERYMVSTPSVARIESSSYEPFHSYWGKSIKKSFV
jgi:hypothetical protein